MDDLSLRPLDSTDLDAAVGLLVILNPTTPPDELGDRLRTILRDHLHYHLVGAFSGDKLVGLCSAWIATRIWCGKYLELDNLVVDPEHRSGKIGTRLISHFEEIAMRENCQIMVLDSYTSNHPSHRLYHRLGFEIWGFHFVKPLTR